MNLKFTWATVLAVAMATMAAPAVADGRGRGHGYRDDHRRHDRHHRAPVRVVHHRPVVHHYHAPPRHVGPPRWARGGYVHHYHRPVYVIHDYHGYGLRHPPHGYRWVRDDYGDMLLVAIATGLIVDMILR